MLNEFGSHTGSYEILFILLKKKNTYRSELIYDLRIDKDTCASTLRFLRNLSLIEGEPEPADDDRRKHIIRLTMKGERVAKVLAEAEKALSGR
jgi:DNA-binding MarR family transcriptional regulator